MKRLMTILFFATGLLVLGNIVHWSVWVRNHQEFNAGDDLHHALGILNRVQLGESRCYRTKGSSLPLQDLGPGGCGGLERSLSDDADNGFTVEVRAVADKYSVKVHPINTTRLSSLYSDQTGIIHFGTRDWPATPDSYVLGSRK